MFADTLRVQNFSRDVFTLINWLILTFDVLFADTFRVQNLSRNVFPQNCRPSRHDEEACPARDVERVRHVQPGSDSGVQRSFQHDWPGRKVMTSSFRTSHTIAIFFLLVLEAAELIHWENWLSNAVVFVAVFVQIIFWLLVLTVSKIKHVQKDWILWALSFNNIVLTFGENQMS